MKSKQITSSAIARSIIMDMKIGFQEKNSHAAGHRIRSVTPDRRSPFVCVPALRSLTTHDTTLGYSGFSKE